jgi:hypothetical protein
MKKRVQKPKAKPGTAKNGVTRKELPRPAVANPHDQLHSLLRGTYAHRVCEQRQS